MLKPLFEVGEEVYLVSKNRPECNGEYTVHDVILPGGTYNCRFTGALITLSRNQSRIGYILDKPFPNEVYFQIEASWSESALRKKYKPADQSLEELISDLKYPVSQLAQCC